MEVNLAEMQLIDLHVHSTASDGSYTPAEVVRRAKAGGLAALALTEHDTIDGLQEAAAAGEKYGVEVLPGVEISARYPGGTMHVLGLLINYDDGQFDERLAVLKRAWATVFFSFPSSCSLLTAHFSTPPSNSGPPS